MKTEKQLTKKYLDNNGALCPICESNDIESASLSYSDLTVALSDIKCNGCGATWTDVFTLTDARGFEKLNKQ